MRVMTQAPLRHGSGATDLICSGGRPDLILRGQWFEGRVFLAHALADVCEHRGAVRTHSNARTWLTVIWRSPLLERAKRRHEGAAVPPEYVNSGGRPDLNLRGRWLEGREYPTWITPSHLHTGCCVTPSVDPKGVVDATARSPSWAYDTHVFTTFLFVPRGVASHVA